MRIDKNSEVFFTTFDASVVASTHPDYSASFQEWHKYRLTKEGGEEYIKHYLYRYSSRETWTDYWARRKTTHLPAHAKATVLDIKNSIIQRMTDIAREGGPDSYQVAVKGQDRGVDLMGNSMDSFMGRAVLPELLFMGKVGVYIDKKPIAIGTNGAETKGVRPYMYTYPAEDIRNWAMDEDGNLTALLLRDHLDEIDSSTGLVKGVRSRFRHLRKFDGIIEDPVTGEETATKGVFVTFYSASGVPEGHPILLDLDEIPFIVYELSDSLLVDVANHQISLLNLSSSDVNFALLSNFPFFTEQYDPHTEGNFLRFSGVPEQAIDGSIGDSASFGKQAKDGTAVQADGGKPKTAKMGTTKGRRYPKGTERPGFIHPSAEPLLANLQLEDSIKKEIRQLVNLTVANLAPIRASADSKREDKSGLEAGLSTIGIELEFGERQIAGIWADYEGGDKATVNYPQDYSLKTDAERREQAKELIEQLPSLPSSSFQKAMAKKAATILVGKDVTEEELEKIHGEIEASPVIVTDPDTIKQDHEAGFVSTKLGSKLRGYPEGESEQAAIDHADRATRIALAQSKASNDSADNAGARGNPDGSVDPEEAKDEKKQSQDPDGDPTGKSKTRGDA